MAQIPCLVVGMSVRTTETPGRNNGDEMYITHIPMDKAVIFFNNNIKENADGIGIGIKPIKSDEIVQNIAYIELMNNIVPHITQPTHSTDSDQLANLYKVTFREAEKQDTSDGERKFRYQPGEPICAIIPNDGELYSAFNIRPENLQNGTNVRDFGIPYKDERGHQQMMHIRFSLACLYAEKSPNSDELRFDKDQFKNFKDKGEIKDQKALTQLTFDYLTPARARHTKKEDVINIYTKLAKSYLLDDLNKIKLISEMANELDRDTYSNLLDDWNNKIKATTKSLAGRMETLVNNGYLSEKDSLDLIARLHKEFTDIKLKRTDRLNYDDIIFKYFYNIIVCYNKPEAMRYFEEYENSLSK